MVVGAAPDLSLAIDGLLFRRELLRRRSSARGALLAGQFLVACLRVEMPMPVKAVNTDLTGALVTTIDIKGAHVRPRGEVVTINGATLESYNSFATPEAVRLTRKQFAAGSTFEVSLPPHSVNVLKLQVTR